MFTDRLLTPDIEAGLRTLRPDVAEDIRRTYRDYAALLRVAGRDRQALLGFIDNLSLRLDDLPADPDAAREVAIKAVERHTAACTTFTTIISPEPG